ncbi:hypothetical protein C8Q78DRAFT_212859 [Trametes maxima]|nr:hypothetical protein C8Q78DRAFT_212859 [Trametes maxima]
MPLRMVKIRKATADNALNVLVMTSAVTKEIADIMSFPPAQAAAGVLLLVFETIQHIQSNRQDCLHLAERCLNLLIDMRDHMADRWEAAPPSLLKAWARFEETLESIHKFVKGHAEQKWGSRLIKKNTIETSLKHHNRALDDAIRSFQMATLVNIHLAVGDAPSPPKPGAPLESDSSAVSTRESTLPPYIAEPTSLLTDVDEICTSPGSASATTDSFSLIGGSNSSATSSYELLARRDSNLSLCTSQPLDEEEGLKITEHHGFAQYHQSQFRMKGKSRIKQGWWSGGVEGEIDGKKSIMLRYELDSGRRDAMKRWMRDVRILQNIYHPNLPQMVGYSNDESPTPFILLANVQTRLPQAMLLDAIKSASLATCAQLLLQFFQETLDAALYLQRQLDLSDSKLQDYVEHADFRIDAEKTVVMGLPPPEVDNIQSYRNYGLAWSIRDIYLKILPNRGYAEEPVDSTEQSVTVERQRKVNHLAVLARALLPGSDNIDVVTKRLHAVLRSVDDEDEEAEPTQMTLRQIRKAAFAANTHQQAWRQKTVPPHKFSIGDLGYMPQGSDDWGDFVTLCNVLEEGEASFEASSHATGMQGSWVNRTYERQDLAPYDLPGEVKGWAFAVSPETELDICIVHETATSRVHQTWDYLLDAGSALAKKHGVPPEDLILVTRVGAEQRFRVRDLRRIQYWPASPNAPSYGRQVGSVPRSPYGLGNMAQHGFGHRNFGGNQGNIVHGQDLTPKVFYLFTSSLKEHQAHFSLQPMPALLQKGEKPPEIDANIVKCFAYPTATYGFLNYVQLHAEDFED